MEQLKFDFSMSSSLSKKDKNGKKTVKLPIPFNVVSLPYSGKVGKLSSLVLHEEKEYPLTQKYLAKCIDLALKTPSPLHLDKEAGSTWANSPYWTDGVSMGASVKSVKCCICGQSNCSHLAQIEASSKYFSLQFTVKASDYAKWPPILNLQSDFRKFINTQYLGGKSAAFLYHPSTQIEINPCLDSLDYTLTISSTVPISIDCLQNQ